MTSLYHYEGHPFQVIGGFSYFDGAEYHYQLPVDAEYEIWRQWRYEHISLEFQLETHRLAEAMWSDKRPWWLGSYASW